MAALKAGKITWDDDLNSHNTFLYTFAVDGTDFKCHEQKYPLFNIDRRQCSIKMNHRALKYEIGIHVYKPKIVWISGPHSGGKSDLQIFKEGLKNKLETLPPLKKGIADSGYPG